MHLGRVWDADGELVEIRPWMEPRGAGGGEGPLQIGGAGGTEGGHVAQPVRSDGGQIYGCGKGAQGWLCRCCSPPSRAGCPARGPAGS